MLTDRHVAVKDLKHVSQKIETRITLYQWSDDKRKFVQNGDYGTDHKTQLKLGLYLKHYFIYENVKVAKIARTVHGLGLVKTSGQLIATLFQKNLLERFTERQFDLSYFYDRRLFATRSLDYSQDLLKPVFVKNAAGAKAEVDTFERAVRD